MNPKFLQDTRSYYKIYTIKGKSGKKRQIEEPISELMELQRQINAEINKTATLHPACMSKSDSSIIHNAEIHKDAKHVLKIDIKSCYQNITKNKITQSLGYQLSESASYIARNIDYCLIPVNDSRKFILPTGAPTSPILCNIALTPLDYKLTEIAISLGMRYSRYIDDMHFSTTEDVPCWPLITQVKQLLDESGYKINRNKSKWLSTKRQDKIIITGIRIATQYKTPLEFYRKLRAMINNHFMGGHQHLSPEIKGCLAYVQQIDKNRYDNLLKYVDRRLEYATVRRGSLST